MLIYNFPNFSGVTLSCENMGEFLEDERLLGVKYTSNDYFSMQQIKSRFPSTIIYNGFDEMFFAGLSMGADGGIGSLWQRSSLKSIGFFKKEN